MPGYLQAPDRDAPQSLSPRIGGHVHVGTSWIVVGDQQAAAGAELRMPDEGTPQAPRAAFGAVGTRHPAGKDPPPRARWGPGPPGMKAALQARLLDHHQPLAVGREIADPDTERLAGRYQ